MPYLGNTPTTQNFISGTDYFNGTGAQTAFTLSRQVSSPNDIQVTVNNVVQSPNSGYTVSGTTLTFDAAPSAGTSNVYVRYLSTTTQVITPSQNTVSWNTLDSNIRQDLGVMYKNRIINGNMVIDQRNAGASVTLSSGATYLLDRWYIYANQASKLSCQQNAGSVTPPVGFRNYLGVTSLSAYSVTSVDEFLLTQRIEGFNTADLMFGTANAQTVTLSFWVRSSLTGTFGGTLKNSDGNRNYPYTYTISSANTWEYKTITIPGDTTGTWVGATNGIGLQVLFGLGVGSTYSGTAGAWTSSNVSSATGATSVVGTNGATFYITGVQLEVGTQATAFTTAGGSYGTELALCQRYYYKIGSLPAGSHYGSGYADTTSNAFIYIPFPYNMRTNPTALEQSGTAGHYSVQRPGDNPSCTSVPTFQSASAFAATVTFIASSAMTTGNGILGRSSNTAGYLAWSAEL